MISTDLLASDLAHALSAQLMGHNLAISGLAPLKDASAGRLTFVVDPETHRDQLTAALHAGAVVLAPLSVKSIDAHNGAMISVESPRAAFAITVAQFFARTSSAGVAETARIDAGASVHPTANIGEYSVVRAGAVIGEGAEVRDHVVIGYDVQVGANVLIKSHAVIGEEGFGMERDNAGNYIRIPHVGSVVLAENVEVGNFVTVCSGTITPTRIGDHTKIDDHVHIAHNCQIGRNVILTAGVTLSGSVVIEDDSWIGPNASVIQGVTIGHDSIIGIGAVAISSVPPNEVRTGNPARRLRDNRPENTSQ